MHGYKCPINCTRTRILGGAGVNSARRQNWSQEEAFRCMQWPAALGSEVVRSCLLGLVPAYMRANFRVWALCVVADSIL